MDNSPFHADERAAQALAGQTASGAGIRAFMPEQHREFFALLPYLFVATADERGWPLATALAGPPGFVHALDGTTLRLDAMPGAGDPAAAGLRPGAEAALLGLDFTTRRRNRANGRIVAVDQGGFTLGVRQSFGNCAQYIQTRHPSAAAMAPGPLQPLEALDDEARGVIATADTFFVASRSRQGIDESGGLDISHRGGRPGFLRLEGDTLVVPDFRGNRYFNTLGNLLGDPRAGLLFVDFATGDLLQLQGGATIDWQAGAGSGAPAGAQRTWSVRIGRGRRQRRALPFRWTFGDYAPTTLATGTWSA